ncbi:predicted protein [Uncinocarpus reesii 1704]|uniref:Uncharacterized protein n=1 Tax=Uncinocarpus reesii (strain UAMH 1704) TaxID=336963 RepID=C4JZP0_UNCRE|nr:uncharacterized protein UREG_07641 [Uncinocarpus reesii 1704]EEP82776.1 predicted protein [Uncinocarpus reesii 1704]
MAVRCFVVEETQQRKKVEFLTELLVARIWYSIWGRLAVYQWYGGGIGNVRRMDRFAVTVGSHHNDYYYESQHRPWQAASLHGLQMCVLDQRSESPLPSSIFRAAVTPVPAVTDKGGPPRGDILEPSITPQESEGISQLAESLRT